MYPNTNNIQPCLQRGDGYGADTCRYAYAVYNVQVQLYATAVAVKVN